MVAVVGPLQLPHELGVCKDLRRGHQVKNVMGQGRLHMLSSSFSLRASHQDAWNLYLSDRMYRPVCAVPSRHNVCLCRYFLVPGLGNEIPIVKSAATSLTRSYNALHGNPLVVRLAPAVGIIAFTVWGLGPLIRLSRNIFLHQSDSSWKRSSTRFVMTSYLQPLLLWTGATLICRALDPVVLPTEASQAVKQRLLNFVRSLSTVLAFAYCLSSLIQQAQKFLMETNDSSDKRNMGFQFAGKAVYTAVWVAAVSLFMELLGFSTQKWLTAGGLGTVLLTLAGREIFTNFLSSVMIHATRPFVLNEWIQTKIEGYEVSGTVEHVGWWSPTIIRGDDREAVHIPNHKFTVNVVRNLSQKTHWRIKTNLAISHLDVNKINNIVADMRKVLAKNPQVEQQRLHRRVFLENINPENQALSILISCFVKTSHIEEYLCVKEAILLDLLRVISHHRARLATPIRTVQKIYTDAEMENIPYADSIFTRGGAAGNRPPLLIEPPYKINGDDKMKRDTKVTTSSESKLDGKVRASVVANPKADAKAGSTSISNATADSRVGVTSTLDSREGSKVGISDPKVDGEVGQPTFDLNTDSKVGVMSKSSSKSSESISDGSSPSKSEKQIKKSGVGDVQQKRSNTESVPNVTTATSYPSKVESDDKKLAGDASENPSTLMETADKAGVPPANRNAKKEGDRGPVASPPPARPILEENIVLGVALEGSKRMLPIDEEMPPCSTPAEAKDLASCRNANGSTSAIKDKDAQTRAATGAKSGDQREQER